MVAHEGHGTREDKNAMLQNKRQAHKPKQGISRNIYHGHFFAATHFSNLSDFDINYYLLFY
jgi:hypothetical protein